MLILCETCIKRIEDRGEEIACQKPHYNLNSVEFCDVCGLNFLLTEVMFPDEQWLLED